MSAILQAKDNEGSTSSPEPTRKYVLTKIKARDWLLPSNDAKTIWRIRKYTDRVPAKDGHGEEEVGYWGLWRWIGDETQVDPDQWDCWDFYEGTYAKRSEAIQGALRVEAAR